MVDAAEEASQEEAAPAVAQEEAAPAVGHEGLHWPHSLEGSCFCHGAGGGRSSLASVAAAEGRASSDCWVTVAVVAHGSSKRSELAKGGVPMGVSAVVDEEDRGGGGGAGREGGGGAPQLVAPQLVAQGPHRGGEDDRVSLSVYDE